MLNKHDPKQFFNTRFISTEGAFSPEVKDLIAAEIASMPENAKVIGAFDNDDQGWKYASELKDMCSTLNRQCRTDIPRVKGYDWNDVLGKSLEREESPEKKQEAGQEQEQELKEEMTCRM